MIFHDARAILLGGVVMCLVGVIDDIFELDAITKLAGEVLAAGIVAVQGIQLYRLPLPGDKSLSMFTLGGSQAALITVILIVATVNAVNFIDGLDGLAAGVVGIGAVAFFTFSVLLVDRQRGRAGHHGGAAHRGARRSMLRLPAAQLLPGPDVHG